MVLTILDLMKNPAPADTSNKKKLMRDTMTEFLATMVFVFSGTLSAVSTGRKLAGQGGIEDVGRILPIAMSFGVSILALAYSIGHITGGHMNPGVTLAMFFKREISIAKLGCYWVAQFWGALMGSALVWGCTSELSDLSTPDGGEIGRPPFLLGATTLDTTISSGNGFLLEFMGSFFFYFVICQTALDKRGIATSMFPAIPIGFILVVVHVCLIPFTGCGVNPARTFGPSMMVCMVGNNCSDVVGDWYWIYYVGPFLASFFAAEVSTWLQIDVGEDGEAAPAEQKLPETAADTDVASPSKEIDA